MVKLQQFYILKFSSDRLKKSKYNIEISLDNARINSEVITINNSQLIRTLFKYKNKNFNQEELNSLLFLRNKIKKDKNNEENRKKILDYTEKIENILYLEDLINIEFTNKSHYLEILKRKGFYVNGIRYVPFMASAGMIRKNTAMFINNNLKHPLMDILENGRNLNVPIVPAKFGAYFSLYSSSTLPISFPRFAVIPDKEIETLRRVDFVKYKGVDEDDDVKEMDYLIKANAWDGQGLITPNLAKRWSDELKMDYTFSAAIIRAPFLKGLIAVFDIESFATEIAKKYIFTDIYGVEQDIRRIELIISESMFKLWNSYENTDDYVKNCHHNNLGFSIAKVNPKTDQSYSRTSYQFLQVLKLNNTDTASLCEPTINWFRNISGETPDSMLLYATGENNFEPKDFKKMGIETKALLLNPNLARDRYIQSRFIKTIEKKKKESYMGSILINANYQFMIGDPYYQACHMFKLDTQPILNDSEHYSEYWLNKGIKKVGAVRSPIVHHSEFNVLNLQDTISTRKWYNHIHSGIILPANGVGMDCAIHGGSDFDGDILCTINNPIMINNRQKGLPVIYESQKAEKVIVDSRDDKKQVESQLNGYNSKVGFATNISSSLYCLLNEFAENSNEHATILKRLKIGRVIQGEIIDSVKGLKIPEFRNHWTKYKKITNDMTPDERNKWEFNNKVLCEIRPAFFRFLYPHYMTRYNKELKKYKFYSIITQNKPFDIIFSNKNKNEDENKIINDYQRNSFFLDNDSVVNKISRYMRTNLGLIGKYSSKSSRDFDCSVLQNKDHILNAYGLSQMKFYLQEYKSFKKGIRHDLQNAYSNIDSFIAYLKKECNSNISSNESELASYAVEVTYKGEISMVEFAWKLFPSGILENVLINSASTIKVPITDENGNIEYLWNRYSIKEFKIEELYAE